MRRIFTLVCLLLSFSQYSTAQAPPNDEPCNAILLNATPNCTYDTYTTTNATMSVGSPYAIPAPGCASFNGGDVWFKVVVPCTGSIKVDCQTGVITDGGMAFYTGRCDSLVLSECDDDDSPNGLMPMINHTGYTQGDTVYIRVWEYGNDNPGTFGICASVPPPPGPNSNCSTAQPFCTGTVYNFPNNTNVPSLGSAGIYGCLFSTPNPVFYYFQIQNPGPLDIHIVQTSATGSALDVDFACWGPFTDLAASCNGISANNIVDCSYSTSNDETCNIPNGQVGEYYVLLLTNYSNQVGNITFQQNGGTASTNCNVICNIAASNTGPVCPGQSINLTSTLGGAIYTWIGPDCFTDSVQNPTGITAPMYPGTYTYTVLASTPAGENCAATTTLTVGSLPAGTAAVTNASCPGVNDGAVTITPSSPDTYIYTLNPGNIVQNNNPVFTGLAPGTYTATFTNPIGCSGTVNNITITTGNGPTATPTTQSTTCPGVSDGQITLTPPVTGGPFVYTLTPGNITQSSPVFTGLAAGSYNITFTTSLGCNGNVNNIWVTNGAPISGTGTVQSTSCPNVNDGQITITPPATGGPFIYTLTPGNIIQNNIPVFTGLAPANYSVAFTNAAGCQGNVNNLSIVFGPPLIATASATGTSCSTVNDGAVTVVPPATGGPFIYTLNPGNIIQNGNPVFTGLAPGTYTVSFTNAAGCGGIITPNPVVTQGAPLTSTVSFTNPPCANINDGIITINPPAPGNYTYELNPGNIIQVNNPTFTGLAPGIYSYIFTEAGGCVGTGTASLSTNPAITTTVSMTMPLCNAGNDGTITLTPAGGVPNYQFTIDNGTNWQNAGTFTGLTAGTYTITIRDNAGCTKDTTVILAEPTLLIATATSTPGTCNGNDGQIIVTGTDGTPGYTYSIDGGTTYQNGSNFVVSGGNYPGIRVKDNNGCVASTTVTVVLIDNMVITPVPDTTICVESSVVLVPNCSVEATVFNWRTIPNATLVSTLNDSHIKTPTATPTDTLTYVVNAIWGVCSREDTIVVNVLHKPIPDAGVDMTVCNYKTDTVLVGSVSDTSGPVNYSWTPASTVSNPDQNTTIATPDSTQVYTLTVTDDYGCNFSVTDEVTVFVQPPVPAYAGHDTIAVRGTPHQLYGSGGTSYVWTPAFPLNLSTAQNPMATLSDDQLFILVVTDAEGCLGTDSVFVRVYDGPNYYVPNSFTPNGDGLNDLFRAVPAGISYTEWFRIYNRYGQLVFQTNRWLKGWDGTYKGIVQPSGTYVWMIKGIDKDGKVVEKQGTVILIN